MRSPSGITRPPMFDLGVNIGATPQELNLNLNHTVSGIFGKYNTNTATSILFPSLQWVDSIHVSRIESKYMNSSAYNWM